MDCDQSDIGESGRSLEVRLAEHQRHVRKGEITRSAIAEQAILQVHGWIGKHIGNLRKLLTHQENTANAV